MIAVEGRGNWVATGSKVYGTGQIKRRVWRAIESGGPVYSRIEGEMHLGRKL